MTAFLRGRTAASASPQLDSASSDAADAEPAADTMQPPRPCPPVTSLPSKRPASASSSKVLPGITSLLRTVGLLASQQTLSHRIELVAFFSSTSCSTSAKGSCIKDLRMGTVLGMRVT